MFRTIFIRALILVLTVVLTMNSCRKDDPVWNLKKILPKVQTISVLEIKATSALVNAKIIHNGGSAILEKGVCFGLTKNPTIENASKQVNSENVEAYSSRIQNLTPAKTYYVRAYAKNETGIAYGNEISFNTSSCNPSISTSNVTNITSNSATSGGFNISDGTVNISDKGIVWSLSSNPTIVSGSKLSAGSGTSSFTLPMSGLLPNKTYYVRAYATNICTTSYGNEVSFPTKGCDPLISTYEPYSITSTSAVSGGYNISDGGVGIIDKGIVWSTTPNPKIGSASISGAGSGTGSFTRTMPGLLPNKTYYVRAYATNICTTSYGNEVSFPTKGCIPSISTYTPSSITSTSAVSGGYNISDGGEGIIDKGIVWSTTPNPKIGSASISSAGSGTGSFTLPMSPLSPNTTYYVNTYVRNNCSTEYGQQFEFPTLSSSFTGPITIGNGTLSEANNFDPAATPFGSLYTDARHVYLIRASELTNQGGRAGNIASISFNVVYRANINLNNFTIKLGTTSLNEFNAGSTSFTYSINANYSSFNMASFATGWREFSFNQPFFWNGSQNIIIEVCFDNASYSLNSTVLYSTTSFYSNLFNFKDDDSGCSLPLMYYHDQRPNIRLNFK